MKNCLLYLVTEDWYFISHRLNLALSAKQQGYRICVICRDNGHVEKILSKGIECYPINWNRGSMNIFVLFKNVLKIRKIIYSINPQIVHFVSTQSIIVGCLSIFFNKNVSKILAFTGLGTLVLSNNIKVKILRIILNFIIARFSKRDNTKILVQNKDDHDFLIKRFNCSPSNLKIIRGSGVNIEHFVYEEEKSYPPFIVTFVGRLIKDKGVDTLIKAFDILKKKNLDIKLKLVGSADLENSSSISDKDLDSFVEENNNITLEGQITDIKNVWKKSHIAVLPSKREGLPMSLLEAAACGKPLIATNVPGCREIAVSDFNALLFEVGNFVQLADAIVYLYTNNEVRRKYGLASRKLVESDLAEQQVFKNTLELYDNLIAKK